jgi:hypothetical protein
MTTSLHPCALQQLRQNERTALMIIVSSACRHSRSSPNKPSRVDLTGTCCCVKVCLGMRSNLNGGMETTDVLPLLRYLQPRLLLVTATQHETILMGGSSIMLQICYTVQRNTKCLLRPVDSNYHEFNAARQQTTTTGSRPLSYEPWSHSFNRLPTADLTSVGPPRRPIQSDVIS